MIKMITEGYTGQHIFSSLPPSGHNCGILFIHISINMLISCELKHINDEVFTYIINKWPLYKMSMGRKK